MRKDFLNFLKALLIFSLITGLLTYFASTTFLPGKITLLTWQVLIYFIMITVVFHYGLLRSSQGKPQAFIRYYMGGVTVKLFVHVIVILMYSLFNRNEAVRFIITFLIFYFLYTTFETIFSVKRFRK